MTIEECTTDEISILREIRKLLNILQTYGDVLVPGGGHALSTFKFKVSVFTDKGLSPDDVSGLIDSLPKVGYPTK